MSKYIVIGLLLLLSGCATVQQPKDSMGLGWGFPEKVDYNDVNQG